MAKSEKSNFVHSDYILFTSQEKFYVRPVDKKDAVLVLDRLTEEVKCEANPQIPSSCTQRQICGVLGLIRLLSSPYLLVATKRKSVGLINKHEVYCLEATDIIPFSRSHIRLNDRQVKIENEYLRMLKSFLQTPSFYFSYLYDLSHSVQRLHNNPPDFLKLPLILRGEEKFIWNYYLLKDIIKTDIHGNFCLPIVHGFVSINTCVVNGRTFNLSIVSRRSKFRAGTRLFVRGIDADGNCANFVETEQIVETSSDRASFVQIRGSIPCYWQQWPNLRLKPKPTIIEGENHMEAFNKHFRSQIQEYGRQVLVNLVDQKGSEGKLEAKYKEMVNISANPNLRYEAFDFHKECSHMRWDRLKILIDRLQHDQENMGVMMMVGDGKIVSQQDGVFRTNCIDCLDRTNVVQSMLARKSLTFVLQKLGLISTNQTVENLTGLEHLFKNVWADNADFISQQYAGSGALKTDFTRTGKRTRMGVIRDLVNSMTRYYKNNFVHGKYQDSIDLFLGNYKVSATDEMVISQETERNWKYTTFPIVFLVAIAMFFANLIMSTEYSTGTLLCLLFWGAMIFSTASTILYYGIEFVDSPRYLRLQFFPLQQTP